MSWPTVLVGEIAQQVRGVSYDKSQVSNSAAPGLRPVLRAGNIQEGSLLLDKDLVYVPDSCIAHQQLLRPGDIVIAASSGSIDVVGKAAQLSEPWEGSFGAFCKVVRPSSERVNPRYLHHFFQSTGYRRKVSSLAAGANINNLKNEHIDDLLLPLAPLEEQRRIAAILDKASRIAELCGTALKLSHAADKSLFLHFFADLPEEIDLLLGELADKRSNAIRTGPFGSQLLHSEFTDSGVAVLGIDNAVNNSFEWSKRRFISHDKYEQLKRYTVFPGDLLVTIMGTCGRAVVVPDDIPQAINTKHLCAISVDRSIVLPEYLHSYILFHPTASRYLGQRTKGAIMEGLNMTIIKEMPVTVPPMSNQIAWLARRRILRSASKRAQSMSASVLSLRQSFSYNLLEERGA
jgi:type I restriction enzyme S subunit